MDGSSMSGVCAGTVLPIAGKPDAVTLQVSKNGALPEGSALSFCHLRRQLREFAPWGAVPVVAEARLRYDNPSAPDHPLP